MVAAHNRWKSATAELGLSLKNLKPLTEEKRRENSKRRREEKKLARKAEEAKRGADPVKTLVRHALAGRWAWSKLLWNRPSEPVALLDVRSKSSLSRES